MTAADIDCEFQASIHFKLVSLNSKGSSIWQVSSNQTHTGVKCILTKHREHTCASYIQHILIYKESVSQILLFTSVLCKGFQQWSRGEKETCIRTLMQTCLQRKRHLLTSLLQLILVHKHANYKTISSSSHTLNISGGNIVFNFLDYVPYTAEVICTISVPFMEHKSTDMYSSHKYWQHAFQYYNDIHITEDQWFRNIIIP
jgi:hypothetical protein